MLDRELELGVLGVYLTDHTDSDHDHNCGPDHDHDPDHDRDHECDQIQPSSPSASG